MPKTRPAKPGQVRVRIKWYVSRQSNFLALSLTNSNCPDRTRMWRGFLLIPDRIREACDNAASSARIHKLRTGSENMTAIHITGRHAPAASAQWTIDNPSINQTLNPAALTRVTISRSADLCEAAPSMDRASTARSRYRSAFLSKDSTSQKLGPASLSKHKRQPDSSQSPGHPWRL